jgi:hypothetical protein
MIECLTWSYEAFCKFVGQSVFVIYSSRIVRREYHYQSILHGDAIILFVQFWEISKYCTYCSILFVLFVSLAVSSFLIKFFFFGNF